MTIPKTDLPLGFVDFSANAVDANQDAEADIQPWADGQAVKATVVTDALRRPDDNLRKRTEMLRGVLDDHSYLLDADRHIFLKGSTVAWNATTGIPLFTGDLYIIPALTVGEPTVNVPPVGIARGTADLLDPSNTPILQLLSTLYSYEGGDRWNVEVRSGLALSVVVTGFTVLITVVDSSTTQLALLTAIQSAITAGSLEFSVSTLAGYSVGAYVKSTQAKQYFAGNWDSEAHVVTAAGLGSFFGTPANALQSGDSLCIRYDVVNETASPGGRRQSLPELTDTNADALLFNSRIHPEYLHNSIPICKVISGQLHFINGNHISHGTTGYVGGPVVHAATHAPGGNDPILSSNLTLHAANHLAAGIDPIDYSVMGGLVSPSFEMWTSADKVVQTNAFSANVAGKWYAFAAFTDDWTGSSATAHWYYYYATAGGVIRSAMYPDPSRQYMRDGSGGADVANTYLGAVYTLGYSGRIRSFRRTGRHTQYLQGNHDVATSDSLNNVIVRLNDATLDTVDASVFFPPHCSMGEVGAEVVLSGGPGTTASAVTIIGLGAFPTHHARFTDVPGYYTFFSPALVSLSAGAFAAQCVPGAGWMTSPYFTLRALGYDD